MTVKAVSMSSRRPWNWDALLFGISHSGAHDAPISRTMLAAALPSLGLPLAAGTPVIFGMGDHDLVRFLFMAGLVTVPFCPLAIIALRLGVQSGRIGCVPMLTAGAVVGALAFPLILVFGLGASLGDALSIILADPLGLVVAMVGAAIFGMAYSAIVWTVFVAFHPQLFRRHGASPELARSRTGHG